MKTQNKKLVFKKQSIVEMNDKQLNEVNGGSSLLDTDDVVEVIVDISLWAYELMN